MLADDEVRQCLQVIINEKCVLTQSQINGELKRRLPAKRQIHDRTVLERMLFRVKLVRPGEAGYACIQTSVRPARMGHDRGPSSIAR